VPNEAQHEFWNGPSSARWIELQAQLDAFMRPITEALLARAEARPGERIVDVGCGCGETSLLLARQAPGATVLGVDLSAPMLAHAASRRTAGAADVQFVQGDASAFDFGAPLDLVVSRFGVMFFEDPVAAFAHLRSALAPGGRFVFACWRSLDANPWMGIPLGALMQHLPAPEPPRAGVPGPFAFGDRDYLDDVLRDAGFADREIEPLAPSLRLEGPLDRIVNFYARSGGTSRLLADAEDAVRARALDAMAEVLAAHHDGEGVGFDGGVWLVRCVRS